MFLKSNEADNYTMIYLLAFNKDKSFFYDNDTPVIYAFLKENYWGDSLWLKLRLLVNLLHTDADFNPRIKKELLRKSAELNEYLNQLQK